ncbi:hypothetical protein [Luteimonas deserti]|uniref:AsmA family protein n=1 Tax=Luteimonas deserti TaxID=2752306 RepID=A0A7Z0QQ89_9GAMM|nr:hypothetical protein [Luteimonas deserti]NYZ62698.1 hypothetical protein [Luteimonas deserti]
MTTAAPAPEASGPRRRRWRRLVLAVVVGLGLLAGSVYVLLPPERAVRLALDRLGPALGLEITFDGDIEYRLRGTPQLVARDVTARMPGEATALLRADRVLLSLPWSTIRSRGEVFEIARVELDSPILHLPALLRWLGTRPPGDGPSPAFTDGVRIRDGVVDADTWRIEGLALDAPSLQADRPVDLRIEGSAIAGAVTAPFRLRMRSDRLAGAKRLDADGTLGLRLPTGRLDTRLHLHAARADDDAMPGLRLSPVRIAGEAHWRARATSLPFAFGLHGSLAYRAGRLELAPVGIAIRGQGPVPTLATGGRIVLDQGLVLALDGRLAHWPDAWPSLPAPLSADGSPLPFALRYTGPSTLDAPLAFRIEHAGARFDGDTRLRAVLQWFDAFDTGSPLPPLRGRLTAGRLELPGAVLEGVQIDFEDGAP